jgi:hypothetical protein
MYVGTEIAMSVRHEAAGIIERCAHWLVCLHRVDGEDEGLRLVAELETELRLLEHCLQKLDVVTETAGFRDV